jgi:hypothetical protein
MFRNSHFTLTSQTEQIIQRPWAIYRCSGNETPALSDYEKTQNPHVKRPHVTLKCTNSGVHKFSRNIGVTLKL